MGLSVLDNVSIPIEGYRNSRAALEKLNEIIRYIEQLDRVENFQAFKQLLLSQLYYLREVI